MAPLAPPWLRPCIRRGQKEGSDERESFQDVANDSLVRCVKSTKQWACKVCWQDLFSIVHARVGSVTGKTFAPADVIPLDLPVQWLTFLAECAGLGRGEAGGGGGSRGGRDTQAALIRLVPCPPLYARGPGRRVLEAGQGGESGRGAMGREETRHTSGTAR